MEKLKKTSIFIDGTWLWHNVMSLNKKIDMGKLPYVLVSDDSETQTFISISLPSNVHKNDEEIVKKRYVFCDILSSKYSYNVDRHLIDFKGRRLYKKDRHPNDRWDPKEKCVDIAVASNILYSASLSDFDMAILVLGDRDFLPVLDKLTKLDKKFKIASFQKSCSKTLCENYEVMWLDDLIDNMKLEDI